jgi:hypothetical protein
MDIYTKLFWANLFCIIFTAIADKALYNDALEKHWLSGPVLSVWDVISTLSIPVYVVYLIFIP